MAARRRTFALVLSFAALFAAGCGGNDEPRAGSNPTTTASPTDTPNGQLTNTPGRTGRTVDVIDLAFVPAELTVTVGTEVIWTNTGTATHSITADDGSFDSHPRCPDDLSACMTNGDVFRHTFAAAGRFPYHCKVHALMTGTIVIE